MDLKAYCELLKKLGIPDPRGFVASQLEVTKGTINSYICGRRCIPIEQCLHFEKSTNRLLQCEDLRPDFDWSFFRESKNMRKRDDNLETLFMKR